MVYSEYKLNKMKIYSLDVLLFQFWTSQFFHEVSNYCFLTCIQISQETGKVVWYSRLFKSFPQFIGIHTVKGFSVVNDTEIDAFWNSLAFSMIQQMLAIWSVSSAFSIPSLNIWKFSVHILLKPSLKDFEDNLSSMWNECNCTVVWTFLALPFFGIEMKTDLFQSYGHCWVFQICWHIEIGRASCRERVLTTV